MDFSDVPHVRISSQESVTVFQDFAVLSFFSDWIPWICLVFNNWTLSDFSLVRVSSIKFVNVFRNSEYLSFSRIGFSRFPHDRVSSMKFVTFFQNFDFLSFLMIGFSPIVPYQGLVNGLSKRHEQPSQSRKLISSLHRVIIAFDWFFPIFRFSHVLGQFLFRKLSATIEPHGQVSFLILVSWASYQDSESHDYRSRHAIGLLSHCSSPSRVNRRRIITVNRVLARGGSQLCLTMRS